MASLENSDPANGGLGVQGAYWAGVLSQELGYTVTNGEPYYTAGCTDTATCVFPNAVIPATAVSPVAQNMLKYVPTPNVPGQNAYQTSAFNQTLTDNRAAMVWMPTPASVLCSAIILRTNIMRSIHTLPSTSPALMPI